MFLASIARRGNSLSQSSGRRKSAPETNAEFLLNQVWISVSVCEDASDEGAKPQKLVAFAGRVLGVGSVRGEWWARQDCGKRVKTTG